jgi:PAS domain S-box-containing protein
MLDTQGRIMSWNISAERLLGYTESEAVGQSVSLIYTSEDQAQGMPEVEMKAAATRGQAIDERWHRRKNGTLFWGSGIMSGLRHADGSLRGFVKVMRDETYRKQAEIALQESKLAAEEANRLKDEFLAVVSHELRTPLSAILLWAKLLESSDLSNPDYIRGGLSAIRTSADAQRQLIEDLLDMSRVIRGQLRLQMREMEPAPVIQEALEAIAPTADTKNITIHSTFDPGVRGALIDPDRLRQVIWNLLSNAVKFTPAGGRVDVSMKKAADRIEIRVADNGSGIDPGFLPHIFERFRQADSSQARVFGGLGLGLSIAKQLVELHGGAIHAESGGRGKGSVFTVYLPLLPPSVRRKAAKDHAPAATARSRATLEGLRVLLVEDGPHTLLAVSTLLTQAGMKVTQAETVQEALRRYQRSTFDIVVSDVGIPGEDGYALIRRLRQVEAETGRPPVPAVALTAFVRETDRQAALDAGFQHHIAKPFEPERLLAAVREAAQRI